MYLTRSFRRKLVATGCAAVGFVFLYEVTAFDSRYAARQAELREDRATPAPGARLKFTATAYCKGETTASGVQVRTGIAAADPTLLPVGSVIQIDALTDKYNGIYTVMDTGPAVQGRHVDLYMWSCYEALDFGRKPIQLTVLRLGWNPRASGPNLLDRVFTVRKAANPRPPSPDASPALAPAAPTTPTPKPVPSTTAMPTSGQSPPVAEPKPVGER